MVGATVSTIPPLFIILGSVAPCILYRQHHIVSTKHFFSHIKYWRLPENTLKTKNRASVLIFFIKKRASEEALTHTAVEANLQNGRNTEFLNKQRRCNVHYSLMNQCGFESAPSHLSNTSVMYQLPFRSTK